jgi:hypothetical protein
MAARVAVFKVYKRLAGLLPRLFFSMLDETLEEKTHLVALMGIEPMFQP